MAGQGPDTAGPDVQPQVPAGSGRDVRGKQLPGAVEELEWAGPGRGCRVCAGGLGAPVPLRVETPQAVHAVFCCSNIKHGCCLNICGWKRDIWVPPQLLGTLAGCHPGMEPAGVWQAAQSTWSIVGQPLSLPFCPPQFPVGLTLLGDAPGMSLLPAPSLRCLAGAEQSLGVLLLPLGTGFRIHPECRCSGCCIRSRDKALGHPSLMEGLSRDCSQALAFCAFPANLEPLAA